MDSARSARRAALTPSATQTIDVRIDSIAAGGDGVGRAEGRVVFVPRTAPGDTARVRAHAEGSGRLLRGTLIDLIEPSTERQEPPCKHYTRDRCGGCQIQHLIYGRQLEAKSGIIRDAFVRIGRVELNAPTVRASDTPWRYRQKLTLAMRRNGGKWIAGLRPYDAPDDVFDLRDCPITDERVVAHWRRVMSFQNLLPAENRLRGAVRLLDPGFSFVLEGASQWTSHADLFAAIPEMSELWWRPVDKSLRLLQSRDNSASGASFTQVNAGVAARLREHVLALAGTPASAIDAYAGTGDIGVALAQRGSSVTTIEIDRDAARIAASRLRAGSRSLTGPVESLLRGALPAELVILNPPRTGVDERVTAALTAIDSKPRAIIYVSCNPATLARDVRRLPGYRVGRVEGFDMFPQTAHVETVCELLPT